MVSLAISAGEVEEVDRISKLPRWEGSKVEVRLWDDTRVDMLTGTHAIEVDWSRKWAEAIGQCLYYAELTDRKPGIILLVKDRRAESRYIFRCQTVCAKYDIKLWLEQVDE
jgi:hypothetical protein